MASHERESSSGSITWKVVASASTIALWAILFDLGKDVQRDITAIKQNTAVQATLAEVTKQRVDINTDNLQGLLAEHKVLTRDVYTIKDQILYWQQDREWMKRKEKSDRAN